MPGLSSRTETRPRLRPGFAREQLLRRRATRFAREQLLLRRATHNRLFDSLTASKKSLRAGLCYYQAMRGRVQGLIDGCYTRPENRTASPGA